MGLGACGGDDGDDGAQGPVGPKGPPAVVGTRSVAPDQLIPKITSVEVSSPMVIEFQVTDERGFGVAGIDGGVSFTVNKLLPATASKSSAWASYFRSNDEGTANAQAGTYSGGTLEDHGDGTYTFTLDQELEAVDGVAYEPDLTHRVGVELRDVELLGEVVDGSGNGVFDFQPSTGETSGIAQRTIVENESCATCHGGPVPFNFHGGPRNDVEYCVTCHQPDSVDVRATAGLQPISIDFGVMVHKIHAATADAQYCGFACEAPFIGGGAGMPLDDFSEVVHPQDVRNCTTCHDDTNPDTPQASNAFNRPTAEVCASCHTDLAFDATGLTNANGNHDPGAASNSDCATCHADGGLAPSKVVRVAHQIPEKLAAARFEYNIGDIGNSGPGASPTIEFSVTDPTNGNAAYDIVNDDAFTGSGTRFVMTLAWPTTDYTNEGSGDAPAQPVSISLTQGPPVVTDIGGGTYMVDTSQIPFTIPGGQSGSGVVTIEGHPAADFDGDGDFDDSVPVTSAHKFFAITDSSPRSRRTVVSIDKCQDCHGENDGLALHGGNRVDNIQVCVVCHNPDATDIGQRPTDPDDTVNGVNTGIIAQGTPDERSPDDDLEERTIDFKHMIHAIHGAEVRDGGKPYEVMGFRNSIHNYGDAHIPRSVANCLACHEEGTYELPVGNTVLGTTVETQATVDNSSPFGTSDFIEVTAGAALDPSDDSNNSPEGAVCYSCHNSDDALAHMNGSSPVGFGNSLLRDPGDPDAVGGTAHTQADVDGIVENCSFCHGPGAIVDVAEAHGFGGE